MHKCEYCSVLCAFRVGKHCPKKRAKHEVKIVQFTTAIANVVTVILSR